MKIVVTHPNITSTIDNDYMCVPIQDLNKTPDSSCKSVNLADCMDYVLYEERDKLLEMAMSKIKHEGTLLISGTDVYAIGRGINNGIVSLLQINTSLYKGRLSINSLSFYVDKINNSPHFELINAKLDKLYYSLVAKRLWIPLVKIVALQFMMD